MKDELTDQKLSSKRKIPLGLLAAFYTGYHYIYPLLLVGVLMLCAPFLIPPLHPDNPFFWNFAGKATIIDIERHQDEHGNSVESILFAYLDSWGDEQRKICITKKCGFFVPENKYSIIKLKNDWNTVTLADLPFSERYPEFSDALWFVTCGLQILAMGFAVLGLSYWWRHWPLKLFRSGNHALGTFLREEKPQNIARILGMKKKMYKFIDANGSTHELAWTWKFRTEENPDVNVFYDPQNPKRTAILQRYGSSKTYTYSPETDSFQAAFLQTVLGWCYWLVGIAIWSMAIVVIIRFVSLCLVFDRL